MSQLWERTPIAEEALSVVVLEAGDVVVLLGTAAAVMAGETRLLRG